MTTPNHAAARTMEVLAFRATTVVLLVVGPLFVGTVYAYARFGGSWVDGLDSAVGEVLSTRAVALARAGRTGEAIDLYQRALAAPFGNPALYVWRARELAELLTEQQRYDEALDAAIGILDRDRAIAMAAFRDIHSRVRANAHYRACLRLGRRWAEASRQRHVTSAEAQGVLYIGVSLRRLGRPQDAAENVLRAFAIEPSVETAVVGARLLRDTNQLSMGSALVQYLLEHAEGDLRVEAQAMAAGASIPHVNDRVR